MAPPVRTEDSLAAPLSDLYTVSSGKDNGHYRRTKETTQCESRTNKIGRQVQSDKCYIVIKKWPILKKLFVVAVPKMTEFLLFIRSVCWSRLSEFVSEPGKKILVLQLTISKRKVSRSGALVFTQGVSGWNVKMKFTSYWRILRSCKDLFSTYIFLP
jgi:hypothetical protein